MTPRSPDIKPPFAQLGPALWNRRLSGADSGTLPQAHAKL